MASAVCGNSSERPLGRAELSYLIIGISGYACRLNCVTLCLAYRVDMQSGIRATAFFKTTRFP